jgi:hypothetical protein
MENKQIVQTEQINLGNGSKKEDRKINLSKIVFNFIKVLAAGYLVYDFLSLIGFIPSRGTPIDLGYGFYSIITMSCIFSIVYAFIRSDSIKKEVEKIISFSFNFSLVVAYAFFILIFLLGRQIAMTDHSGLGGLALLPFWSLFVFLELIVLFFVLIKISFFIINKSVKIFLVLFISFLGISIGLWYYSSIAKERADKQEKLENAKMFASNFKATEIAKADLPFSLKFWAEGSCPGLGANDEYIIPNGYKIISCEKAEKGSHNGCKECQMINIEVSKEKRIGIEVEKGKASGNDYFISDYSPLMMNFIVNNGEVIFQHKNDDNTTFTVCRQKEKQSITCTNEYSEVIHSKTYAEIEFKEDQNYEKFLNINGIYYGPYQWFEEFWKKAIVSEGSWIFAYMQNGKIYVNANDFIYGPYDGVDKFSLSNGGWGFSCWKDGGVYAVINGEKYGPYSTITALDVSGQDFGFIYRDIPGDFYLKTSF